MKRQEFIESIMSIRQRERSYDFYAPPKGTTLIRSIGSVEGMSCLLQRKVQKREEAGLTTYPLYVLPIAKLYEHFQSLVEYKEGSRQQIAVSTNKHWSCLDIKVLVGNKLSICILDAANQQEAVFLIILIIKSAVKQGQYKDIEITIFSPEIQKDSYHCSVFSYDQLVTLMKAMDFHEAVSSHLKPDNEVARHARGGGFYKNYFDYFCVISNHKNSQKTIEPNDKYIESLINKFRAHTGQSIQAEFILGAMSGNRFMASTDHGLMEKFPGLLRMLQDDSLLTGIYNPSTGRGARHIKKQTLPKELVLSQGTREGNVSIKKDLTLEEYIDKKRDGPTSKYLLAAGRKGEKLIDKLLEFLESITNEEFSRIISFDEPINPQIDSRPHPLV